MASIAVGTVCMKVAGRESGAICCVVKPADKTFVMITGPKLMTGVKRRKCNIDHLEPVGIFMEIKDDASDEEVIEAYKKSNVVTRFNLKLPSAGDMKSEKAKAEEKKTESKEKPKEEPKKTEKKQSSDPSG